MAHTKSHDLTVSDSENANTVDSVDNIPNVLKGEDRWVCWESFQRSSGKFGKKPVQPCGKKAKVNYESTWSPFKKTYTSERSAVGNGIGFVFTQEGPFVGIDLDDCVDDGNIDEWAQKIVDTLDSYTEYSPSGTGLHILVKGDHRGEQNRKGDVEIYDDSRYFTMTGDHVNGTPSSVKTRQDAIEGVHEQYLDAETDACSSKQNESVRTDAIGSSDQELLEKAKSAENGDKFKRLWSGNTAGYNSHSQADLALCSMLAYWTGRDENRIDRLFRRSGLYRPKWDNTHSADGSTYGEMTIEEAIDSSKEYDTSTQSTGSVDTTQEQRLC